jgi:hypothetical protein
MSILEYNGAAIIAMTGKNCVGIACDTRLGAQAQTVSCDFRKVFQFDKTFGGLAGLATDVQTMNNLLQFRKNLYELREERQMTPKPLLIQQIAQQIAQNFGSHLSLFPELIEIFAELKEVVHGLHVGGESCEATECFIELEYFAEVAGYSLGLGAEAGVAGDSDAVFARHCDYGCSVIF